MLKPNPEYMCSVHACVYDCKNGVMCAYLRESKQTTFDFEKYRKAFIHLILSIPLEKPTLSSADYLH